MPGSCLWCVSVRSALLRRLVVWALALVFIAGAQAADGVGVSGAVKDPSGAAVPGAQVSLQTAQQVILGSARTDSRGRFTFDGVLPGSYVLVVESKGFAEQRVALQVEGARKDRGSHLMLVEHVDHAIDPDPAAVLVDGFLV